MEQAEVIKRGIETTADSIAVNITLKDGFIPRFNWLYCLMGWCIYCAIRFPVVGMNWPYPNPWWVVFLDIVGLGYWVLVSATAKKRPLRGTMSLDPKRPDVLQLASCAVEYGYVRVTDGHWYRVKGWAGAQNKLRVERAI